MRKQTGVTVALGVVLAFAFAASSVKADAVHSENFKLERLEEMRLHLPDVSGAEERSYLFTGIHANNGKHLGFSISSFHAGPRIGVLRPSNGSNVTQNPEPATMILLGTGLAAVGAAIRRRRKV